MSFTNPFAGDSDFQYLALDRKKLMEEAPPYDAKTSCWVPDQREGFMRANIQSTKGDDITVLTEKGEVRRLVDYCGNFPCMISHLSKIPARLFCNRCEIAPKMGHGITERFTDAAKMFSFIRIK